MRNWRPYSSIARDGEKTVYCQRGKHSVYYGDAFVSFKPSKLIWCADCKDAFYKVKPTLFDEINSQTEEKKEGEMNKFTYLTGTGPGNKILVTKKEDYTWLEFSNEDDCKHFLKVQPKAEFKGVKGVKGGNKTYTAILRNTNNNPTINTQKEETTMLEEPTYENTYSVRDDDDLQFIEEEYFKQIYAEGIRFICILKWGQCFAVNEDGSFDHYKEVPCSAQFIKQLWEDYNS